MGLSDIPFEGSNDGKLEGLVIGFGYTLKVVEVTKDVTTPGYIGRIVCGCTEVIDLGIYYGYVLGTTMGAADVFQNQYQKGVWL